MLLKEELLRIGFVNKISGYKGSLKCIIDISRPDKLLKKKYLFLILDGLPVPFAIEEIEIIGTELIIKFEGIDSEAQAKKYIRKEIFADAKSNTKKNEFHNWKGVTKYFVVDENHGELGIIEEILEYPMQYIAKCIVNGKEILFPLNDEIVLEIDSDEKKIFTALPDGLLDIYLE